MRRPMAVRVVGPGQWILIPALAAILCTIILATPFELFGLNPPEPVWPMVLAFAWPLIRPSILAPITLGFLGLFLDKFWGGPLGLWAVCLVSVYVLMLGARPILAGQDTQTLFTWYCGACFAASMLGFCITTLVVGNMPSLIGLLFQVIPTILLFPIAHWMLELFDDGDVRFR